MTALRQESIDMLRRIPEENVEEVYNFLVRLKPKEPQTKKHTARGSLRKYADRSKCYAFNGKIANHCMEIS